MAAPLSPPEPLRVAFLSYHAAFDPTNGAARTMRDVMQLLASHGVETASLTGPCVDRPSQRGRAVVPAAAPGETIWHDETLLVADDRGTPSLAYLPDVPNGPEPGPAERDEFLSLAAGLLGELSPHVVLTYGGGAIGRALIAKAKSAGAAVAFRIMNFRYGRADLFSDVDRVLVPADFVGDHYRQSLGLTSTSIPCPLDWSRTYVAARAPRYVTYVAPSPDKGGPWAASILTALASTRPHIPLLVVEGRGSLAALARLVPEPARSRIHATGVVRDPRSFLAETRVLLMPSYEEPSGRLAQEAVINGIPVVASDRGGLPETLREAGVVLPIDAGYTRTELQTPPDSLIEPWTRAIERLWDDAEHDESERLRCERARERWRPERLATEYLATFEAIRPKALVPLPRVSRVTDALVKARSAKTERATWDTSTPENLRLTTLAAAARRSP